MMDLCEPRTFRFAVEAIETGTAQVGGGARSIKLAAGASAVANYYNQKIIVITGGTGKVGERGLVELYDETAAKLATIVCLDTVDGNWTTNPAGDTTYSIYDVLRHAPFQGIARAGAANTAQAIILGLRESIKDGFLEGLDIELFRGPASRVGHKSRIIKYTGATRVAEIDGVFLGAVVPTDLTHYQIQGHLYYPCGKVTAQDTAGALLITSSWNKGGIGLGASTQGNYIESPDGAMPAYLELAMATPGTVEIARWEVRG